MPFHEDRKSRLVRCSFLWESSEVMESWRDGEVESSDSKGVKGSTEKFRCQSTERSEEVGEDVGDQLLKSVKEAAIKTSEN